MVEGVKPNVFRVIERRRIIVVLLFVSVVSLSVYLEMLGGFPDDAATIVDGKGERRFLGRCVSAAV